MKANIIFQIIQLLACFFFWASSARLYQLAQSSLLLDATPVSIAVTLTVKETEGE